MNEGIVQLAKVMGFRQGRWFFTKCWYAPPPISERRWIWWDHDFFSPLTDANDDVFVLRWAYKHWRGKTKGLLWKDRDKWLKFKLALTAGHLSWEDGAGYFTGAYTIAVCKVLGIKI